jgi:hypothetical protein
VNHTPHGEEADDLDGRHHHDGGPAVVSGGEPDRVHAVLTRAGLADVSHVAVDDDAAPLWLMRARGRD